MSTLCFGQASQPSAEPQSATQQPTGQPAGQPAKPHPGDLYKQAMQPLEIVRSSLDNWSDAELAALTEGMHQARQECGESKSEDYTGDDLYDLARLCALGQDWNSTLTIAQKYLASGETAHRARAYATAVNALVQMRNLDQAVKVTEEMLRVLPFDAVVAETCGSVINYLQLALDPNALKLALELRPPLLDALNKATSLVETNGNDALGIGDLYEEGMQIAFLQSYAGKDSAPTVAELKAALSKSTTITSGDQKLIEAADARYGMLGAGLIDVPGIKPLTKPPAKASIGPVEGLPSVWILFPQWCPQCRKMMKPMIALAHQPGAVKFSVYGLIMQDTHEDAGSTPLVDQFADLRGMPVLLIPPSTAQIFGATKYPFVVVADKTAKICYLGPISSNAFEPHGLIEEIIRRSPSGKILLVQ
ncbi:TlpA family protein disulfide reductase [Acidicapsa dinghuensis]|uniref:TlpA family protein disulfide reductase n=1 Tax=Acidicapsa dinghuensis TaxID=2218256 RepID=A0ABW1ELG4_9BACT|nr:hypothetical protein [Acidicapsa dinghuensis]